MDEGDSAYQRVLLGRLKLFGAAAAAIMLVLLALIAWQGYRARTDAAMGQTLVTARTLAGHAARDFDAVDAVLDRLAARLTRIMRIGDPPAEVVRGLLARAAASQPILRTIAYEAADGRRIGHSAAPVGSEPESPRLEEGDRAGPPAMRDGFGLTVVEARTAGRRGLLAARPVVGPDGAVAGTLVADLAPEVFAAEFEVATDALPLALALVTRDGTVLAASGNLARPEAVGGDLSRLLDHPAAGGGAAGGTVTLAGVDHIVSVMPVGGWPVAVAAVVDLTALLWDWHMTVGLLVLAGLIILAVVAAAVRLMSRNIGRLLETEESLRLRVADLEDSRERLMQQGEEVAGLADQLYLAREDAEAARHAADVANQAKSEFLARMSHELRTPLNAILGFSEIMKEGIGLRANPDAFTQYAGDIHESGSHLLAVINDILDLAKVEAGRLDLAEEPVDLPYAVRSVLRLVRETARRRGLSLVEEIAADTPRVRSDQRIVKQMLLNLLSNALKFTPAGGSVTVTVAPRDGGIALAVRDTGIGIAEDDLDRVLEPFGQVQHAGEDRVEGTGLGLPLVKSFIEAQDGTFALDSTVGEGTTVTLWFPPGRILEGDAAAA